MPLYIHLLFHFVLAVLSGLLFGIYFKRPWLGVIAGICSGFLIDLDHVLEYFLVFGPRFDIFLFFNGRQFLASDQIRIFFHAWEYIPLLLLLAYFFRKKTVVLAFILAFTFAGAIHLVSDCLINYYPPRNYSIIYRAKKGFLTEKLLDPSQYKQFLHQRKMVGIEVNSRY